MWRKKVLNIEEFTGFPLFSTKFKSGEYSGKSFHMWITCGKCGKNEFINALSTMISG